MLASKILVVGDEKLLTFNTKNSLQKLGYNVSEITGSNEEVTRKITEITPDLVLIDICILGIINGGELASIIQNIYQIPVLCLIEYSHYIDLHRQQLSDSLSYILKPFAEIDLHIAVEMAFSKHQINKRLREEKERLTAILNSMACAVVTTYTNGNIQMINPMAEALTGWKQDEGLDKDLSEVVCLVDEDVNAAIENLALQSIAKGEVLHLPENCTLIAKNGREISVGNNVAPIRDHNGNITGAVLVFHDMTYRKQIEAQILHNAFYDGLTALANRVLFIDRLKLAVERRKRRSDYHFAVLFLDLDNFEEINDRLGHGIGDDFLVAIARRLESCVRSGDTVSRFGGDEFAVLLEEIRDVSDAVNVAKRIQDTLGLPLNLNGHQIFTTASIGIAYNCGSYHNPESMLRDADTALYRAKQQGKARYGVFDKTTNS